MSEKYGGPSNEMLRNVMDEAAKARSALARAIRPISHYGHSCGGNYGACGKSAVFGGIYDGSEGHTYQIASNKPSFFCTDHMGMIVREAYESRKEQLRRAVLEAESDTDFGASYTTAESNSVYSCEKSTAECGLSATHFYSGDEGIDRMFCSKHAQEHHRRIVVRAKMEYELSGYFSKAQSDSEDEPK